MNEDICKRDKSGVDWSNPNKPIITIFSICCNPKDPDFLYCDDCMREVFDENSLS